MSEDSIQHLPKQIDELAQRFHFYETLWKRTGLDLLAKHAGDLNGLQLLDYGCGRGETLRLASEMGMAPFGTDIDEECVSISRQHGQTTSLIEAHDPAQQFGLKSFDVVTCFHVLEHVDRPRDILTSLGRIARRYVLVAIPNLRALPIPRYLCNEPQFVNDGHLQGWDHAHFRNLAERHCGLKLLGWGHDQVRVPVLSNLAKRVGGNNLAIRLETGLFLKLMKFHSSSIIALLEPIE